MNANLREHGNSRITTYVDERPTFRFGNGQTRECISTADLGVSAGSQKGEMTVHVHGPRCTKPTSLSFQESFGSIRCGDRL